MRLPRSFGGTIIQRADVGYNSARQVFNSAIDRTPHAIIYCTSELDVSMAVRATRDSGMSATVRATGHGVSGKAIGDDVVVIDLTRLNEVRRDENRLFAQGGATWGALDTMSSEFGLFTPGGTVSTTGIGGLTLGGGIGWLLPSGGLACDGLVSARLVTADGSILAVDDEADAELMRGLRGSGHALAAVTEFGFEGLRLLPIIGGSILIDPTAAPQGTFEQVADLFASPSRSLMVSPAFVFREGRALVSVDVAVHGGADADLRHVERLHNLGGVVESSVRSRSYPSLQSMLDNPARKGMRAYWSPNYFQSFDTSVLARLFDSFTESPSHESIVFFEHLHGQFHVERHPSAFPGRLQKFAVLITANWIEQGDDERNRAWVERMRLDISDVTSSQPPYSNYLSDDEQLVTTERIRALKTRVDPTGLYGPLPARRVS